MSFDFDQPVARRHSESSKWRKYPEDVLPMWVADMDFAAPESVLDALHARVDHGVFGYSIVPPELLETVCERLWQLYSWSVSPEELVHFPGLVSALNVVSRAHADRTGNIIVQTPVYPPFLAAPPNQDCRLITVPLEAVRHESRLHYQIDFDRLELALRGGGDVLMLCNPHNPVGRVFTAPELQRIATLCLRYETILCSDEIHCDLLLDQRSHIPIATLAPEIAQNCVTLMAPSKTFNIAGLAFGFAIVQNPDLRARLKKAGRGIVPSANPLSCQAALAAYQHGGPWLEALRTYLAGNRDLVTEFIDTRLPELRYTIPEATYLTWLDCRGSAAGSRAYDYLLKHAQVALNDGRAFGTDGEGFVRLNFGCPRATLQCGLERMHRALRHPW